MMIAPWIYVAVGVLLAGWLTVTAGNPRGWWKTPVLITLWPLVLAYVAILFWAGKARH